MEPGLHDWFDKVVGAEFPRVTEGYFPVPSAPGLGFDIDEAALLDHPPRPESFPSSYLRRARLGAPQLTTWR